MDEGTKNTSFDHISAITDPHVLTDQTKSISEGLKTVLTQPITRKGSNSIARQIKEEKASSTIKLEDLAKLVPQILKLTTNSYSPVLKRHHWNFEKNKAELKLLYLKANPPLPNKTKFAGDRLKTTHTDSGTNEESKADDISRKLKLEDLSEFMKDTRSEFFTFDSPQDEPIIVTDESEEEEAEKDDTQATSHNVPEDTSVQPPPSPKSAQIQELMAHVQLFQSQKDELQQQKAKADAEPHIYLLLPTDLKELPSKFTELSGEIKELKQHVKVMEIELPGDFKEIPTKLETFTSTISSLTSQVDELKNIQWELPTEFQAIPNLVSSVQTKPKTLVSLPSLLNKVTQTLDRFATMVDNASRATIKDVPLAAQETASPAEGEKNTNDAETNLKDELINILGTNVVTQYYNKKLLFDKYCNKMLKTKSPKITNYEVLIKKGPITLKIYREDGSQEVISNLKVSDLHLAKWREVIQACPDKSEKGWKTIYDLVKTRLDQLTQTEKYLKIDFNKPLKEQDPLNELNELANKKRKRTSDLKDHSTSTKKHNSLGPQKIGKYLHFSLCSGTETEEGLLERASVQLG
ncbi:hypothetical protein Tco_0070894 [Tanacetum coccineum]